jgi:hypothetical protein
MERKVKIFCIWQSQIIWENDARSKVSHNNYGTVIPRWSTLWSTDTLTICPNTLKNVATQPIYDCQCVRAMTMLTSSATSGSHFGSTIVQSFCCSLFSITFCIFLNTISEIMGHTQWVQKQMLKLGLLTNKLIINVSWNQLMLAETEKPQ